MKKFIEFFKEYYGYDLVTRDGMDNRDKYISNAFMLAAIEYESDSGKTYIQLQRHIDYPEEKTVVLGTWEVK